MKVEIITIGDEILIGQVVDTNSAWMGQRLSEIGCEISSIQTVRDLSDHIKAGLDLAINRSDVVLITGGLGPTKDDITKHSLCEYFNCDLVFHESTYSHISSVFKSLNKPLRDAHRSQAMLPSVCEPLINAYGTAPGMLFHHNGCIIISMPGVPYEMKGIMEDSVLPLLAKNTNDVIVSKTLVTANVPESIISEKLESFENSLPQYIKLAYLPHFNFVRLRLTGRGDSTHDLHTEVETLSKKITAILGNIVISENDEKIERIIGRLLSERNMTVTFAESCTGGYVAHLITGIPGSSHYFPGSVVTYSYDNKTEILGVEPEVLWNEGAVSQKVVEKMSTSVRLRNRTDFALALSGIAGPDGGTEDKPVGTLWIAVCNKTNVYSKLYQLKGNREQNIQRSAHLGLEMLRKLITNQLEG